MDTKTKRRLLKLCDYMESLPRNANKHFHMGSFSSHSGDHDHWELPASPQPKDLMTCGTTACALGWATTMPTFRRLGLHFNAMGSVEGDENVFELSYEEWDVLFEGHNEDRTPGAWAKRVRKWIADGCPT